MNSLLDLPSADRRSFSPTGKRRSLLACAALLSVSLWANVGSAQTNFVPELTIVPAGVDQVTVTVLNNADPQLAYQILYSAGLTNVNWGTLFVGDIGETNFTFSTVGLSYGYFRASPDLDWDGDGVENWKDANPYSTNVGLLSVTIELPVNGATIY